MTDRPPHDRPGIWFPYKLRMAYWFAITCIMVGALCLRVPRLIATDAATFEIILLLVWIMLVLAPLFPRIDLWGLSVRQELTEVKHEMEKLRIVVNQSANSHASVNVYNLDRANTIASGMSPEDAGAHSGKSSSSSEEDDDSSSSSEDEMDEHIDSHHTRQRLDITTEKILARWTYIQQRLTELCEYHKLPYPIKKTTSPLVQARMLQSAGYVDELLVAAVAELAKFDFDSAFGFSDDVVTRMSAARLAQSTIEVLDTIEPRPEI